MKKVVKPLLWGMLAFVGGIVGGFLGEPHSSQAGVIDQSPAYRVVGTYGVGGVITQEGKIWQYRPDKSTWLSLDESFALEGQGTTVEPLPVPMSEIRHMETFGFLVDSSDRCWLYDIENRVWNDVGTPPVE